ncbi:MAG: hypothetical protein RI894_740 [Bacteroidota bacterium]|jgi:predicted Zn-dependent peptidase
MLNRKIMPTIGTIDSIAIPQYETILLENGVPLHVYTAGTQPVVKLDIVFRGGRCSEEQRLAGTAAIKLLREGTTTRTSAEIAEYLDFYGGTLYPTDSMDTTGFTLYCLSKHLEPLLQLVVDLLCQPLFPENELQTYIENAQHGLRIDLDKNDTMAYRIATAAVFGDEHPYGYNSTEEMYAQLTRAALIEYRNENFVAENCFTIASGQFGDTEKALIQQYLAKLPKSGKSPKSIVLPSKTPYSEHILHHSKKKSLQSAICLARPFFNREHPDYIDATILNVVFGGYFGSRLMSNIREDKGYTYGIYSSIGRMKYDGYWLVSAEVGKKVAKNALKEIYFEMDRLQSELISDTEMTLVRNYLMGQYLQQLDGVFSTSNVMRELINVELPMAFYEKMITRIKAITPERLQELAKMYLCKVDFYEVVVG